MTAECRVNNWNYIARKYVRTEAVKVPKHKGSKAQESLSTLNQSVSSKALILELQSELMFLDLPTRLA